MLSKMRLLFEVRVTRSISPAWSSIVAITLSSQRLIASSQATGVKSNGVSLQGTVPSSVIYGQPSRQSTHIVAEATEAELQPPSGGSPEKILKCSSWVEG